MAGDAKALRETLRLGSAPRVCHGAAVGEANLCGNTASARTVMRRTLLPTEGVVVSVAALLEVAGAYKRYAAAGNRKRARVPPASQGSISTSPPCARSTLNANGIPNPVP